jgi:predicted 3-demethylubiquinone-9 3-methyltransferase (glyoxalase superfamily)
VGDIDEVIAYYSAIFEGTRVESLNRMPGGDVITAELEMAGQRFMLLKGGPQPFTFTDAISFFVRCQGQAEVDHYWDRLTADGGQESQCGWLKDKFGMSWQIVPKEFEDMMAGDDPAKVQRMITAMLQMRKLDIATLQKAYDGT